MEYSNKRVGKKVLGPYEESAKKYKKMSEGLGIEADAKIKKVMGQSYPWSMFEEEEDPLIVLKKVADFKIKIFEEPCETCN